MKTDHSYGIIPLRVHQHAWEVLLIQHHSDHWSFPKGHPEGQETPKQAAERELNEETGLSIQRFLSEIPLIENYFFTFQGQRIYKTVEYFIALVEGTVAIQELEIKGSRWILLSDAVNAVTFKEGKRVCLQVGEFLKSIDLVDHFSQF